jgi:hypothetical protein
MLWRRANFRTGEWLMLFIGVGGLCWMGRLAPLFVMIAAPMLAAAFPALKAKLLARPLVWALLGSVMLLGVIKVAEAFPARDMSMAKWLNRNGADMPGYPTGAAQFVATRVPPRTGRIINDFNWGGYLAWQLGPQYQVFMDARTQLYAPEFWRQTCLRDVESVESVVRDAGADAAIVPAQTKNLARALARLGWREVYRDQRAMVLVPPDSAIADTVADIADNKD